MSYEEALVDTVRPQAIKLTGIAPCGYTLVIGLAP